MVLEVEHGRVHGIIHRDIVHIDRAHRRRHGVLVVVQGRVGQPEVETRSSDAGVGDDDVDCFGGREVDGFFEGGDDGFPGCYVRLDELDAEKGVSISGLVPYISYPSVFFSKGRPYIYVDIS